jgi:hypothetical protein
MFEIIKCFNRLNKTVHFLCFIISVCTGIKTNKVHKSFHLNVSKWTSFIKPLQYLYSSFMIRQRILLLIKEFERRKKETIFTSKY